MFHLSSRMRERSDRGRREVDSLLVLGVEQLLELLGLELAEA